MKLDKAKLIILGIAGTAVVLVGASHFEPRYDMYLYDGEHQLTIDDALTLDQEKGTILGSDLVIIKAIDTESNTATVELSFRDEAPIVLGIQGQLDTDIADNLIHQVIPLLAIMGGY